MNSLKRESITEYHFQVLDLLSAKKKVKQSYCLTITSGSRVGQVYRLKDSATVIGRSSDCDLVFSVSGISRRHLMIANLRGTYYLTDLESTNGTYVNGVKVTHQRKLSEGDDITVEGLTFRFSLYDAG